MKRVLALIAAVVALAISAATTQSASAEDVMYLPPALMGFYNLPRLTPTIGWRRSSEPTLSKAALIDLYYHPASPFNGTYLLLPGTRDTSGLPGMAAAVQTLELAQYREIVMLVNLPLNPTQQQWNASYRPLFRQVIVMDKDTLFLIRLFIHDSIAANWIPEGGLEGSWHMTHVTADVQADRATATRILSLPYPGLRPTS